MAASVVYDGAWSVIRVRCFHPVAADVTARYDDPHTGIVLAKLRRRRRPGPARINNIDKLFIFNYRRSPRAPR